MLFCIAAAAGVDAAVFFVEVLVLGAIAFVGAVAVRASGRELGGSAGGGRVVFFSSGRFFLRFVRTEVGGRTHDRKVGMVCRDKRVIRAHCCVIPFRAP